MSSDALPTLSEAQEYCRQLTFDKAKNFAYAFLLIPKEQRKSLCTAYAWCRLVDDIADEEGVELSERGRQLDAEAALLESMSRGEVLTGGSGSAIHVALQALLNDSSVRVRDLHDLIAGMKQDLTKTRYATFGEMYDYCYHAASTVGLICLEIFQHKGGNARVLATEMGIALQLTNILRDVKEDLERDRIYLPRDELDKFEISEEDLRAGKMTPKIEAYFQFFAKRALRYYKRSEALFPLVRKSSRLCPRTLHRLYKKVLEEIIGRNYDVFSERVSLSKGRKLRIASSLWIESFLYV